MKPIVYVGIIAAVLVGAFFVLRPSPQVVPEPTTSFLLSDELVAYFTENIEASIVEEIGRPREGFTPAIISSRYAGLLLEDFHGAEAVQGEYQYNNGTLEFVFTTEESPHSAADALTEAGMRTLLANLGERFEIVVDSQAEIDDLMSAIE